MASKIHPNSFRSDEKDWPVLLHAMVCVRQGARTSGWLKLTRTGPSRGFVEGARADYTSDARDDSYDALIGVLERMIEQIRRQRELARESQR